MFVRKTSLYHHGAVEFSHSGPRKQLMFTVNNLAESDEDFQNIRLALQLAVERSNSFNIQCPSTWLIFSLVLRAKHKMNKVLSYEDCFTIALSCGILDRLEMTKALNFLHNRLGLIRYYNTKELNMLVVIDPQTVFDRITDLLVRTFVNKHAEMNEIEEFQQRGTFSITALKRISKKCQSNSHLSLEFLLNLLSELRIGAYFNEGAVAKYLIPSAVLLRAPLQPDPLSSCGAPPLLIAFEGGFCPRGVTGALIKYLLTNEMKSTLYWKLHTNRVFRNQVTFAIDRCGDIIIKFLPTHIEVSFDPESDETKLNETCIEAHIQIKQCMETVFKNHGYYFGFYCTLQKCESQLHPAKINWVSNELNCEVVQRRVGLLESHLLWKVQQGMFKQYFVQFFVQHYVILLCMIMYRKNDDRNG